jgi:hypothetical protein
MPETMVESSSAVLNLPFEVKIPATADHRRIIKHSYRDRRYYQIKDELTKIVNAAFESRNQKFVYQNPTAMSDSKRAQDSIKSATTTRREEVSLVSFHVISKSPWS